MTYCYGFVFVSVRRPLPVAILLQRVTESKLFCVLVLENIKGKLHILFINIFLLLLISGLEKKYMHNHLVTI